ncbi:hypothetical protein FRC01_010814, partial [Tulasnella sp. 417]
ANSELEETVARLKEKQEKCDRDRLKLEKKYLAAKLNLQELQKKHAKCKQARPRPSSEADDSLEIIPPPRKLAPWRNSASSSSLRHSALNTSLQKSSALTTSVQKSNALTIPLQKSNSTSSLLRTTLPERKRPFARVASLPSTSQDVENVEPPTDGDWEDASMVLPREPSSSRSKPRAASNLTNALVSMSKPKSKPPPFPFSAPPTGLFSAPRTNSSRSKGKERALPSSEPEIVEIAADVPVPASKRRKVSNDLGRD